MKKHAFLSISGIIFTLLLGACSSTTLPPTVDLNAVSTAAVQTLVARPTETSLPTRTATATNESTPTLTSTPIPTIIPTSPAPTFTPVPSTPTTTPSPTVIVGYPTQVLESLIAIETYAADEDSIQFENECFKSAISNSQLHITAKGLAGLLCWTLTWGPMQNFFTELTVTMPDTCHSNDRFGIIFRAPDSSKGYLYGLTCNGRYFLSGWNGETYFTIIDYTENWLIQPSPGATNRLSILVQQNSYALYANGSLLDQAIDDTFLDEGMIGYFISAASDQPFTVSYDDVAIWSLIR